MARLLAPVVIAAALAAACSQGSATDNTSAQTPPNGAAAANGTEFTASAVPGSPDATAAPAAAANETTAGTPPAPASAPRRAPAASTGTARTAASETGQAAAPRGTATGSSFAAGGSTAPAEPPAPPKPEFQEVTIPSGTTLNLTLSTSVASDTSHVEDVVRASLRQPVVVAGLTAIPKGSAVVGNVTEAERSGRVKGKARVAFRFTQMTVRGESTSISTSRVAREAESNQKEDLKKGGIGAGVGAIVGGIAGGGKGAALGAGIGGAGAVMATRGDEVRLPSGTAVTVTLQRDLQILVPLE